MLETIYFWILHIFEYTQKQNRSKLTYYDEVLKKLNYGSNNRADKRKFNLKNEE
jgi:hypothetical protein